MKKLSEVTPNQVIKTTEENDLQFRQLLDKEGYINNLIIKNESRCYRITSDKIHKDNFGLGDVEYYANLGFKILNASDFLKPKISKKELLERIEGLEYTVEANSVGYSTGLEALEERVKALEAFKKDIELHPRVAKVVVSNPSSKNEFQIEGKITIADDEQNPQFEVGKVYKGTIEGIKNIMFYCTEVDEEDEDVHGFGFCNDNSWGEIGIFCNTDSIGYAEATQEEWQARLEEEAVRLGYKDGVIFAESILKGTFFMNFKNELFAHDKSGITGVCVMKEGKWAEIIKPQYKKGMVGLFSDNKETVDKGFGDYGVLESYDESEPYPFERENGTYFKHFRETEPIKLK